MDSPPPRASTLSADSEKRRKAAAAAADLATRLAAGDPRARDELCARYYRRVLRLLLARCPTDRALAEDLTNETFATLLRKLPAGDLANPAALSSYCIQTATNIWLAHVRKEEGRGTSPNTELVEQTPDLDALSAQARLLREERARLVRQALEELRLPRDREVLRRFYLLEQEKARICRELGMSANNFDSVIHRAKERLRTLMLGRDQGG